jgi:hypothetical protein
LPGAAGIKYVQADVLIQPPKSLDWLVRAPVNLAEQQPEVLYERILVVLVGGEDPSEGLGEASCDGSRGPHRPVASISDHRKLPIQIVHTAPVPALTHDA